MGVILDSFDVETVLRNQLDGRLRTTPGDEAQIHFADEKYWLTPLHDVYDLLVRNKTWDLPYLGDQHDCDDFAWHLKDLMHQSIWGNRKRKTPHCFGMVWGMTPEGGHAINVMLNEDGAVRFVEPQAEADNAIMTVSECDMTDIWLVII